MSTFSIMEQPLHSVLIAGSWRMVPTKSLAVGSTVDPGTSTYKSRDRNPVPGVATGAFGLNRSTNTLATSVFLDKTREGRMSVSTKLSSWLFLGVAVAPWILWN